MSYIISATDQIAQRLRPGMLIVLESTTYPGTTEELILPRLFGAAVQSKDTDGPELTNLGNGSTSKQTDQSTSQQRNRPTPGRDFYLAFSPERIDPGRRDYTVHNTPKVIGGLTRMCTEVATALYSAAIDRIVPVSSPRAAEMVKLLENTFRAVNIALVNEVAIMCDRLDIDVWEVIEAAKTKPFGYMPFYPGPGLGGHCIPIDPEYLAWKLKTLNYNARFIQLAGEINFGMPDYVVDKVTAALNDARKAINGSRILILGVAYKADVGDLRESPALDIIHELQEKGADIAYHDPYVPYLDQDGVTLECVRLDSGTLQQADCVVITTDHRSYDWQWIVDNSRLIVDTRNATRSVAANRAHVVGL
jgi:UDP-N-acetyl-D-glucosamine dehydrogenase